MFSRLLRKSKRKSGSKQTASKRRLGIEPLEHRRVLAASNLGAVSGVVFIDNDGNDAFTAGEQVPNAQIQLYEDTDDNNMLDIGTDTLIDTATTDANGVYVFSGLQSGNYFAFQPNQTPAGGVALPQQVSPRKSIDGAGVATTQIDNFEGDSGPTVDNFPTGTPVTQDFAAVSAIGGNRQFTANFLDGPDGQEVRMRTEMGDFLVAPDVQSIGEYTVLWDGGAGGFNATGLGGVDLTASDGAGFCLQDLIFDQADGAITFRVYTDADNFSEATIDSITPLVTQDFFVSFTDAGGDATFSAAGPDGGADFTNVGAIELIVTAQVIGMDGTLENFGTFGLNTVECDFQNDPPPPEIDVEKFTNGQQADLATDADVPVVAPGSTVTWTYQVTNTGTVDIVTVDLEDDEIGAITMADFVSGDTNDDDILNPNEVWTFRRTGTAITGFYDNQARVEGFSSSGLSDVDTDTSNYRGAEASIDIEKFTNGNQADLATDVDVPNVNAGSAVTWTYQVTNTGSIELTNVQVVDSIEGNVATISSMGNGDATLDVGEVWTYTQTGTALAGAYENSGMVSADATALNTTVNDSDLSHYFGVQARIDIEKATNGIDADSANTGPAVNVGDTVTFTYVVTNTGNTPISNVVVVDDAGTAGNAADDFSPTFTGGDADNDSQLDVTEVWTYEATRTATLGAYTNTGQVTGRSQTGATVQDSDPSNHRGRNMISKRSLLASSFR